MRCTGLCTTREVYQLRVAGHPDELSKGKYKVGTDVGRKSRAHILVELHARVAQIDCAAAILSEQFKTQCAVAYSSAT